MNVLWISKKQSLKFKEKSLEYKDQTTGKNSFFEIEILFFKFSKNISEGYR